MWYSFDGLKESSIGRISGELYVDKMMVLAWSEIVNVRGVRSACSLLRWAGSAHCFRIWQWIPLVSVVWCHGCIR